MNKLANPPKYLRAPISRGGQPRVDRDGGYRNAGLIRGVSVITKGEALGHGLWIDDTTLEQVSDAINATTNGIKSRFTHPSLSGDGLGKHVGRIMGADVDGDQVTADQHFLESAHNSPDGDLAGYLMSLAEEDPQSYGLSIAFGHDPDAMEQFVAEHSADGTFRSPDPQNTNNFPHVRIAELHAADAVDEPAANPRGLFYREQDIAREADAMAAYALGLSSERPATVQLGLDPERVRGFVDRFLSTHNLEIKQMADEPVQETNEQPVEPTTPETPVQEPDDRAEAQRFRAKFGDKGAVWFAEGLTFDEARDREVEVLRNENDELKQKLAARPLDGELSPVGFDAADQKTRNGFASKIRVK